MENILTVLSENQDFILGLVPGRDGSAVEIVKQCKSGGPQEIELQNEFNITHGLKINGIRKAKRIGLWNSKPALFLEFIPGRSLKDYLSSRDLSVREGLDIAIAVIRVLNELHNARIIHKNINPKNIILGEENDSIHLLDFAASSSHALKIESPLPVRNVEGSFAFISPEQTGRINFTVDFRSDYYSFGVVMYLIFTGRLPCPSTDPAEQVHFHLAQKPIPPNIVKSELPEVISEVILKMLSKNPLDRYQSAVGILHDLEYCREQLLEHGVIKHFPIAAKDFFSELRINDGIYGREKEIKTLLEEFETTLSGRAGMVLLEGYSGIGKTSLVKEIVKPVFVRGGSFISGKFDQYQRDIPYSALVQALEKWVKYVLAEDEEGLNFWQETLKTCLGETGGVITSFVPGIERIIGPQAPVPELSSDNTRIRFNDAVCNFFRAIARDDSPIVLFLDDMQWADFASIEVLKLLFQKESGIGHLMLVCAYRENEIGPDHPFTLAIQHIERENGELVRITLGPLGKEPVSQMLAEVLHLPHSEVEDISTLILKKTHGNPFFIRHFLDSLRSENLLYYLPEKSRWSWDLEKIRHQSITENVADLLTRSFSRFPAETLRVLGNASVIGGSFGLNLLSESLSMPHEKVLEHLEELLREELIMPADGWQKSYFSAVPSFGQVQDFKFRFGHDKIRDHIYSSISEAEKKKIHLALGKILRGQMGRETDHDLIFETIGHLNKAVDLLDDPSDRLDVATLNYNAGIRAKSGGAYQEAIDFFQTAISLLPADTWEKHYPLSLDIYSEASSAAYSGKDFNLLFKSCDAVFQKAKQPHEKLTAIKSLIFYYDGVLDDKVKVLSTLRSFLKQVNINVGEKPGNLTVLKKLLQVRMAVGRKTDEQILNMPQITSPHVKATMQMMALGLPAAYRGFPTLYVVLVMESLLLDFKHGHMEESAFLYCLLGVISFAAFGDISAARRFHKISLEILSRFGSSKEMPMVYAALYTGVGYLSEPAEEIAPKYNKAFLAAKESGNYFWAAINLSLYGTRTFWTGKNLGKLQQEVEQQDQLLASLNQKNYYMWDKMTQQAIACMRGEADDPSEMNGKWYDGTVSLEENVEGGDTSISSSYYAMKYYLASIFDQPEKAEVHARYMHKYLRDSSSEFPTMMFKMYEAVFNAVNIAEGKGQTKGLGRSKSYLKYFKKLANICPANFDGKPEIIQGAIHWANKQHDEAEAQFMSSAQKSGENGYHPVKALAYELAARQAIQLGLSEKAGYYLQLAISSYSTWGATGKVKHLHDKHASILNKLWLPSDSNRGILNTLNTANLGENIDFLSILKASKAMLGEIALDKLLEKLMRIVLENGGATRGVIFLENNGKWSIEGEAEGETGVFSIQVLEGSPMEDNDNIPESVINYVINSKEPVVLGHAGREGNFTNDPYIVSSKLSSILCLPLVNQGKLSGILYLENKLAAGAFSDQKNEVLKILSSEIAISIENARLYYNLNNINKAYERFVPKQFLSFLKKERITDLNLGDQVQKEMAVMFADIRNFTTLSEQVSAEESFNFINSYLGRMEPAISQFHGFIDKYIGDEIMALFPTGVQDSLDSAIAMLKRLEEYNREIAEPGKLPIEIGIGINVGSLILGIIGGENRWDGTVISDAVNLASRFQELTREYNVSILLTEFAWSKLENPERYSIRKIDRAKIKGKSKIVTVYEVFDADPDIQKELKLETLLLFSKAIDLFYEKNTKEALALFQEIHKKNPADTVTSIYVKRCLKALESNWLT